MAPSEARTREELDAWLLVFGSENTRGGTILPRRPAPEAAPGVRGVHAPTPRHRLALGRLPLPDRGARPGGGDDARRLRRLRLRRLASSTGTRERERMSRYTERFDAAETVRIVGPGTDLTLSISGPLRPRRRCPLQHAGRRVLLLAARGLGGGRGRVLRVPRRLPGRDLRGRPPALRGRQRRRRLGRPRTRSSCSARSTPTRARAGSASSASAATPASSGTRATRSSTRRSTGRCTSRSAPGSPLSAGMNQSAVHWDMVKDLRRRADRARRRGRPGERRVGARDRACRAVRRAAGRAVPRRPARLAGADPDAAGGAAAGRGADPADRRARRLPAPADELHAVPERRALGGRGAARAGRRDRSDRPLRLATTWTRGSRSRRPTTPAASPR